MDSYHFKRMDVRAFFLLITVVIVPNMAVYAQTEIFEFGYGPIEVSSDRPQWSERQIIVKFLGNVTENDSNAVIRQYGCSLIRTCSFAYSQGVTVVCAAGNEFLQGNPTSYPAAYDEFCIGVGATRYDETRAFYSNTGDYVDVVAPGGDLTVDQDGNGFGDGVLQQTFGKDPNAFAFFFFQGTSMAAPHVSGAAALLVSNGISDPDLINKILETTAQDLGPAGWDDAYGWGLIDIGAALNLAARFNDDNEVILIDLATSAFE